MVSRYCRSALPWKPMCYTLHTAGYSPIFYLSGCSSRRAGTKAIKPAPPLRGAGVRSARAAKLTLFGHCPQPGPASLNEPAEAAEHYATANRGQERNNAGLPGCETQQRTPQERSKAGLPGCDTQACQGVTRSSIRLSVESRHLDLQRTKLLSLASLHNILAAGHAQPRNAA